MLSDRCLSCPVCPVCNVGVLWPNDWMDQDETWHTRRPRPWLHYDRRGLSPPPNFRPMSVVAKQLPISAIAEHLSRL